MGVKFANNATTSLSAGITAGATTVSVADASVLPAVGGADYCYVTLVAGSTMEIVKVTSITANDLTVVRAQDGTSASAFIAGDTCELRVTTAALIEAFGDMKVSTYDPAGVVEQLIGINAVQTLSNKTMAGLTVTGTLSSVGIIDTAAGKRLTLTSTQLKMGDQTTNGTFDVLRGRTDAAMHFSFGSTSGLGANFIGYGESSAAPNKWWLRQNTVSRIIVNDTGGNADITFHDKAGATALTLAGITGNVTVANDLTVTGTLVGYVIGTNIQAYDADTLKADVSDTLTVGILGTSHDLGNLSAATTLSIADGNIQHGMMTGPFTLTAPDDTNGGYLEVELTMNATGGYALTLSGFNEITGTFDNTANVVNLLRTSKLNTNTYLEITQAA